MSHSHKLGTLVMILAAFLSLGFGLDKTFSQVNRGLENSVVAGKAPQLYVVSTEQGLKLTNKADEGRYFLSSEEIAEANQALEVSLTLLEYKDSRTVTRLRLERWSSEGLLSTVYEGHQLVAVPVRSGFVSSSELRRALSSGLSLAALLFVSLGAALMLLLYLGRRRAEKAASQKSA